MEQFIRQSHEVGELAKALCAFQLKVEPPKKDSENPHFRSRYADLSEVIRVTRIPLSEAGLCVSQSIDGIDDAGKLTIKTYLFHVSGQWTSSSFQVCVDKTNPQKIGSAITYGRRYSLAAILNIAQEDDDGNSISLDVQKKDFSPVFFDDERDSVTFCSACMGHITPEEIAFSLKRYSKALCRACQKL